MRVSVEELLGQLLSSPRVRESRVLSGGVYKDEPIVRTGRQAFSGSRPTIGQASRIAQMRRLSGQRGWWGTAYANPKAFYEQARLMEDYTDDLPFTGTFSCYFPSYDDMDDVTLRGYFTWRTHWREGEAAHAPLSFLFVHAYELLCGVGTEPGEACLGQLGRLRATYSGTPGYESLDSYLDIWMSDYVIYHGLDVGLLGRGSGGSPLDRAVGTISQAEQALLASPNPAVWDASLLGLPGEGDLTRALAAASRYRLERSRCFSEHVDELAECCCHVFARMVDHCHRRRKLGYADGLFGTATATPYAMFRSAVFYDPTPPQEASVRLEGGIEYRCKRGSWTLHKPHRAHDTSVELGNTLHEVDRVLREQLGGMPPLKPREVPKYQRAFVEEEVEACLARRAALEASRVRIDRTALQGIRSASVRTREALLVDEERAEEPLRADVKDPVGVAAAPGPAAPQPVPLPAVTGDAHEPSEPNVASAVPGLSMDDARLLRGLLDGTADVRALERSGTMVSLAVDRINEALFDILGDTALEYDGDVPHIVEDYMEDVREVLG